MDSQRAKEILYSDEIISVLLDGQSVWIENVDTESNQVHVKINGSTDGNQIVSANELKEI